MPAPAAARTTNSSRPATASGVSRLSGRPPSSTPRPARPVSGSTPPGSSARAANAATEASSTVAAECVEQAGQPPGRRAAPAQSARPPTGAAYARSRAPPGHQQDSETQQPPVGVSAQTPSSRTTRGRRARPWPAAAGPRRPARAARRRTAAAPVPEHQALGDEGFQHRDRRRDQPDRDRGGRHQPGRAQTRGDECSRGAPASAAAAGTTGRRQGQSSPRRAAPPAAGRHRARAGSTRSGAGRRPCRREREARRECGAEDAAGRARHRQARSTHRAPASTSGSSAAASWRITCRPAGPVSLLTGTATSAGDDLPLDPPLPTPSAPAGIVPADDPPRAAGRGGHVVAVAMAAAERPGLLL